MAVRSCHLKAYEIDGDLRRKGAANFTSNGERQQDNDLVVIRDTGAAAKYEAHFQRCGRPRSR
jgi:hypothetical protein